MRDLLGADVEDHVAVFRGCSAVPALEEIGHHDADLAPLAAQHLLELLGIDGVGPLGPGVILELVGAEEHRAAPLLRGQTALVTGASKRALRSCVPAHRRAEETRSGILPCGPPGNQAKLSPGGSGKPGQGIKTRAGEMIQAVAYLRISSATNIGTDKDGDKR